MSSRSSANRERSNHTGEPAARAVLTYPLLLCACAFALGIFAGSFLSSLLWLPMSLSVLTAFGASMFLIRKRFSLATVIMLLVMTLLGVSFAIVEKSSPAENQVRRLLDMGVIGIGDPVELTGVLNQEPELAPERLFLTLEVRAIRFRDVSRPVTGVVMLQTRIANKSKEAELDALDLHYGAQLRVMTRLERADSFRNPGVSSFTEYLDRRGYDATGLIKSPLLIERLENERVFLPLAWLYEWRGKIQNAINSRFSSETAGVLDAALLGNRYFLSQSSAERFRTGGTFHVLVISGLHVTFLGALVFLIARRMTRSRVVQFLASAVLLWAYAIAVGAEASVVRATLMFTIVVLAPLLSRHANSRNALGASAFALLVWRPSDLFDPSFQLTFASVAAIILFSWPLLEKLSAIGSWQPNRETPYPPSCAAWLRSLCELMFWSEKRWQAELAQSNHACKLLKSAAAVFLERIHLQRALRYAFSILLVSFCVQLMLLPLLIIYFHRLSIASLILNVGVGMLMAITAMVALLALALTQVSVIVASPLISLANGLTWLMVHSVDPFTQAGIASTRLPEYGGWAGAIYAGYFLPLAMLIRLVWSWKPLSLACANKPRRLMLAVALPLQFVAFALLIFHPGSQAQPDGKLHLDFLDVGQGDSALITMPDGAMLLVDGGGRPGPFRQANRADGDDEAFARETRSIGEMVVSEFLWQRGIDHVDYILATHADADHIDGLNDIAKNFQVRAALVARTPVRDPEYIHLVETVRQQGIAIHVIGAGDELRFGNVLINILWPPPAVSSELPSQNDDSLVLRVTFGRRMFLLTGDIEARAERAVLQSNESLHADVVKVAHHGSRTSSTGEFVATTEPHYAVISVGQTSIFGHPNAEVVKRWEDAGAAVLRTGNCGTISFSTDGKELWMETFVKPK